ncbi:MAG: hypothetical protein ACK5AZ_27230, partial [Bryobacteraceae bacterium]
GSEGADMSFGINCPIEGGQLIWTAVYTYSLGVIDYHLNIAWTNITVTTPPAGSIDARRTGVHALGAHWGAAGEQIDMRSGNLNYSIPLVQAHGRNGRRVTFGLSYNSQMWRQDPGGTWKFGNNVGYGFGWRLMAGSITPYWSDYVTVDHYIFADSTGTEYRLDINTSQTYLKFPKRAVGGAW